MKDDELREIINNGESFLNILFDDEIKNEIVDFSNGLASICHSICSYICEEAGIIETLDGEVLKLTDKDLDRGIIRYMEEETDTLKNKFDIAMNRMPSQKKNAELIFKALLHYEAEGATVDQLYREVLEESPNHKKTTLSGHLSRLTKENNGGLIIYDEPSKKYSFAMPLYKTYAFAYLSRDKEESYISTKSLRNKISKMAYEAIKKEQTDKYIKNN